MIVPKILLKNNKSYVLLRELENGKGYLYKESITGKNYIFDDSEIKLPIHIKTRNIWQEREDGER